MKGHSFFDYARIIMGVLLLQLSTNLFAQPSGSTIIEDVLIADEGRTANIHITFSCAVQYVTHYPHDQGSEIRIKLKPFFACDIEDNTIFQRESIRPENNEVAMLEDIDYENELEGGTFLNLSFQKSVLFEIRQSSDFRSLNVIVHQDD